MVLLLPILQKWQPSTPFRQLLNISGTTRGVFPMYCLVSPWRSQYPFPLLSWLALTLLDQVFFTSNATKSQLCCWRSAKGSLMLMPDRHCFWLQGLPRSPSSLLLSMLEGADIHNKGAVPVAETTGMVLCLFRSHWRHLTQRLERKQPFQITQRHCSLSG